MKFKESYELHLECKGKGKIQPKTDHESPEGA
jgi:hypothetical protein